MTGDPRGRRARHRLRHRGRGERGVPRRRRSGRAAAHPGRRAAAVRAGARAGRRDQPRGGALRARRPHPRPPGARRRRRAARLRGPPQPGARAAAQRRSAPGCTCGRTAVAAPAPTARYVLHAGPAGFGFAAGRVHAVHTAWSGNHVHYAERVAHRRVRAGRRRAAAARRGPARAATRPTRARGSTARTATGSTRSPAASTATCGPGRAPVSAERPVTLNVWEAVYFDHDRDRLLDLADRAAAVGVERFVLDDGWFGAPPRRPRGPRRLGGRRPRSGPTGCTRSSTASASWACSSGCGSSRRWSTPTPTSPAPTPSGSCRRGRSGRSSRGTSRCSTSASPRRYAHVKRQIAGAARRVRHRLHQVGPQPRPRRGGHADRRRAARRARPDARLLPAARRAARRASRTWRSSPARPAARGSTSAVLERTDRVWVSDNIDPLDRQRMLRWTGQLLPPE